MKGLLLAEKPSVMRAIKEVYDKNPGILTDSLEFGAFHGHLMGLKEPEEYYPGWANRQDRSILPMFPSKFGYHAEDKESVNKLMAKIRAGGYDFLVNACDAGREGEHIFWSFYETMGLKMPVKRFWASSVTKPAIKTALKDLKDAKLYDGMRQAAKLRAQFDWLVGMNFTRAATIATQQFTPIGRVQSPVLKLFVDRELEIRNFKAEKFYEVKCNGVINGADAPGFSYLVPPKLSETRLKDKTEADKIASAVKAAPNGMVMAVKETVKEIPAPTLYSLAELEKDANKWLKFTLKRTDEIAQALYEAGFISYPRSESRFLPTDMINEIPSHVASCKVVPELMSVAAGVGQAEIDAMVKKNYINDAGITDHHAIIPTDQPPDWNKLSADEQKLYALVCKSFLAIFLPPYKVATTSLIINVAGHAFGAKGKRELDKGYMSLYPASKSKDVILPACKKGDPVSVKGVKVTEGTTKPPQRYTPASIIAAMQNAGNSLSDAAMRTVLRESAGLGTSASRTEILKRLEDRQLVELKENAYYATDKGIANIQNIGDRDFASPILTAQWEEKLRAVENNKFKGNFVQEMTEYVKNETDYLLSNLKAVAKVKKVVGRCPFCGEDLLEYEKVIICAGHKKDDPASCKFWFPKVVGGTAFTDDEIRDLIALKSVGPKTFQSKTGANITGNFQMVAANGLSIAFNNTVIGKCPICGGNVIARENSFICENHRQNDDSSCSFWICRSIGGVTLTDDEAKELLTKRKIGPKSVKKKDKSIWKVFFCLNSEHKLVFENAEPQKIVGKCPKCGKNVVSAASNFFCEGIRDKSCSFSFPKVVKGAALTDNDMADLLNGKKTRDITFTWASGKKGRAKLYLVQGALKWEFQSNF